MYQNIAYFLRTAVRQFIRDNAKYLTFFDEYVNIM